MSTINKDFRVKHGLIVEANTHINQNLQVDGTINGLNVNAQAAYTQAAFDQANTGGGGSANVGLYITNDTFTANGLTDSFTLSVTPINEESTIINFDGITQQKSEYSLSGRTITFAETPNTGTLIEVNSFVNAGNGIFIPSGNLFNQDLNTSNNVTFNQIIVSSNTTSNSYKFNTSAGVSVAQGEMAWNSSDGTVDIGVGYADVVLQVGQETHYVVRNNTGSQILNGTALYCSGVTTGSGRLEVSPMIGNGSIDPVQFIGLATHNINNGVNGIATYFGYIREIDTRGTANTALSVGDEDWQVGDKLYVHPTANGKLTKVEPQAPNTKICTAVVITRHQTVGVLFVRPTTNLVLSKLSDAQINTVTDGELLQYVSANNRWENKSSSSIIEPAFTQANSAITLTQAAFDKANTAGGGGTVSLNNDTTSTNTFFPVFANSTTGNVSTIYTSNDKFLYKPSTGDLFAEQINADNGLFVNRTTILNSHTIAEGFAGLSSGPVTLANGVTLTISANSKWSVI